MSQEIGVEVSFVWDLQCIITGVKRLQRIAVLPMLQRPLELKSWGLLIGRHILSCDSVVRLFVTQISLIKRTKELSIKFSDLL